MPDTTRQVETRFTLTDRVTAPLRRMHATATRVTSAFDRATATISRYGVMAAGAAGVYGVASTLMGAQNYLRTVRDINAATGFQAAQVDSVLEVMDRANISAMEGSQIIQKMSISMQRYKMEVERTGKAQSAASQIIQKLGVNLEKGPQAAMIKLAEMAKASKLSMADLTIAFQVSETSAIRLQALLKRGPQEVGRIMTDLQEQGLAVNAQNIAAFNRYEEAVIRIKSAWNRIAIVVSAKVMPVVAGLLEKVRDRMEAWTANADKWGEKVVGWLGKAGALLDKHLSKVIMIGKVMAVNAALQATTGVGLGRVAAGGAGMLGRIGGRVLGGAAGAGAAAAGGAGAAAAGGGLAATLSALAAPLAIVAAALAAVAAVIVPGVIAIRDDFEGVATTISDLWDRVTVQLGMIFDKVMTVMEPVISALERVMGPLGKVFTRDGPVGRFFMLLLPTYITMMLEQIDYLLTVVQAIPIFVEKIWEAFNTHVVDRIVGAWQVIADLFDEYITSPILQSWDMIKGAFSSVYSTITNAWDAIKQRFTSTVHTPVVGAWKKIADVFDKYILGPILNAWGKVKGAFGSVYNAIIGGLNSILMWLDKKLGPLFNVLNAPLKMWKDSMDEVRRATADALAARRRERQLELSLATIPGGRRDRGERQQPPVNDFRGSKFDIKQMFAEGFDPDRIAAAFSSDLADLGEKRIQSGLAPLFAVR